MSYPRARYPLIHQLFPLVAILVIGACLLMVVGYTAISISRIQEHQAKAATDQTLDTPR